MYSEMKSIQNVEQGSFTLAKEVYMIDNYKMKLACF